MATKLLFQGIVRQSNVLSRLAPVTVVSNCQQTKPFSISKQLNLREISEKVEGNTTIVEGHFVKSPRTDVLLQHDCSSHPHACSLCQLQLDIKYTDVLIISQFLAPDCTMLPQYVTKICKKQHYNMQRLANKAIRAGLIKNLTGDQPLEPPYKYMKYNVYFKN